VLGALLSQVPHISDRPRANLLCGAAFAILVIVPWYLALRPL
jgi:hypothetical protein